MKQLMGIFLCLQWFSPVLAEDNIIDVRFYDAAYQGNLTIIQEMLQENPNANRCNFRFESALSAAISMSHFDIATRLLGAGADPDGGFNHPDFRTPLMEAARMGSLEMVNLLLDKGANPLRRTSLPIQGQSETVREFMIRLYPDAVTIIERLEIAEGSGLYGFTHSHALRYSSRATLPIFSLAESIKHCS